MTSCPGSAVAKTQMPRITKVTTTKVRTKINAAIASPLKRSNVHYRKIQNYLRLANLGFFEHRHGKRNPGNEQFFRELGANPGGHKFAKDFAVFTNATLAEDKYVLHGDHLTFHTGNLRETDDFAGTVAETADLNHHIDGRSNLPAYGMVGDAQIGHGDHGFQAAQGIARSVRVDGGE